jgi:phytoene synthase
MSGVSVPDQAPDSLDAQVRRADADRWLASRFIADATARADVIALYAFNIELSGIAAAVREPLMGEIRLTWWREAVEAIIAGEPPRRHPVVEALSLAVRRRSLAAAPLQAMIEARFADLDGRAFDDAAAAQRYIDETAGAVIALAVAALGGGDAEALRPLAQAWGLAGLARIGRLPTEIGPSELRQRIADGLSGARAGVAALPVAAFPAIAYAALARPYAAGRTPSELEKRLRLTLAVLAGRV